MAFKSKMVSTKIFDGFSTCFRQWSAENTHCKYLHGYAVSFKIWFEGELDHRNWVFDFGGMKRSKTLIDDKTPKEYFDWLLDHTVIIAESDPSLEVFKGLNLRGLIQLRVLPEVGAEKFAEFLLKKVDDFVYTETTGRVRATKLEFFENTKNSAIAINQGMEK